MLYVFADQLSGHDDLLKAESSEILYKLAFLTRTANTYILVVLELLSIGRELQQLDDRRCVLFLFFVFFCLSLPCMCIFCRRVTLTDCLRMLFDPHASPHVGIDASISVVNQAVKMTASRADNKKYMFVPHSDLLLELLLMSWLLKVSHSFFVLFFLYVLILLCVSHASITALG